jgi:endonuclease/exonuclease/phosphatase family metal-dependent hydrolase
MFYQDYYSRPNSLFHGLQLLAKQCAGGSAGFLSVGLLVVLCCFVTSQAAAATCEQDPKACHDTAVKESTVTSKEKNYSIAASEFKDAGLLPAKDTSTLDDKLGVDKDYEIDLLPDGRKFLINACSPLRWVDERIVELPQDRVADPRDAGAAPGVAGAIGMRVPPPPVHEEYLNTGLNILAPVEVNGSVALVLNWPQSSTLTGATLLGQLPGNLRFDYLNGRMAIYTPCHNELPGKLPHPSFSERFSIRLHSASGSTDIDVVLPVRLHVTAQTLTLNPRAVINRTIDYSGGPLNCAGMPNGVPCGSVTWYYQPAGANPLPAGLSLQGLTNGKAELTGTVDDYAASSAGKLRLQQRGVDFITDAIFQVPITFSTTEAANFSGLHDIERGQHLDLQLPSPRGGAGANYVWHLNYYSDQLPNGLHLTTAGRITGTVAAHANIGTRDLTLTVSSPGVYPSFPDVENSVQTQLRLTVPFNVWTQNTFLRPADLPQAIHDAAETTVDIGSVIGGWFLCGPPCAVGGLLTSEALDEELARQIENAYDGKVQNTLADNQERMALVLDQVAQNDYDIVALQEVFQFSPSQNGGVTLPHITQMRTAAAPTHFVLEGPQPDGFEMNSGLALLVKRALSPIPSFNHPQTVYQNAPLTVANQGNTEINFDALAQKGATIDKIHFGPLPDDYIYLVNTHMQAGKGAVYDNLRTLQQDELFNFINLHTDSAHPVVIVGDLNVIEAFGSGPGRTHTNEYFGLLGQLGLGADSDVFRGFQTLSGDDGFTVDTTANLYTQQWGSPGVPAVERLDYILVRQGTQYQLEADSVHMTNAPVTTSQCTTWQMTAAPTLQCYLSDHFGLEAQLRLVKP